MRKRDTLLRDGLGEAESNRLITLLSSMSIDAAVVPDNWGRLAVYVASDDLPAAAHLLEDDDSERIVEREASRFDDMRLHSAEDVDVPPGWFGRGSSAVFALAAVCVAVFVLSIRGPEAGTRSRLLGFGAIGYAEIREGELWRFLTAVFLHFDISHLISNMAAMIVIAPPLAHQIGALRFLVVFLVGGVGANVASYAIAPTVGLKAGASGGIAAVLGALGGLGSASAPAITLQAVADSRRARCLLRVADRLRSGQGQHRARGRSADRHCARPRHGAAELSRRRSSSRGPLRSD